MDISGLCKFVSIGEIRKNNHILTPRRYIDLWEEDDEVFEDNMKHLTMEIL